MNKKEKKFKNTQRFSEHRDHVWNMGEESSPERIFIHCLLNTTKIYSYMKCKSIGIEVIKSTFKIGGLAWHGPRGMTNTDPMDVRCVCLCYLSSLKSVVDPDSGIISSRGHREVTSPGKIPFK